MNIRLKKTLFFIMTIAVMLVAFSAPAFGTSYILSWDLVDSGKHLDYDGNSIYMSYITTGASKWNGYKSGVIRPDSVFVIEDVYVSDINVANGNTGLTYSSGKIELNTYYLSSSTTAQLTKTATHELGHALGLDHSTSSDIMGAYQSSVNTLTQNDKDSYDASYLRY